MKINLQLDIDALILLADIHGGSQYAPLPSGIKLRSGNRIRPNEYQRWLNRCWDRFWEWADFQTKGRRVAVAVLGDSSEGQHHGSRELSAFYEEDHINIVQALLRPHIRRRPLVMVEGTECHDKDLENAIGRSLGAVPWRKPAGNRSPGVYSWPQVDLDVRGVSGILRHHIATTIRPYLEASAMSIQLGCDRIERVRSRKRPPQFVVSAHRHRFGAYTDGDAQVVILPPWQGLTRHGRKVVPHAITHVGGAILDFTGASKWDPPAAHYKRFVP